MSYWDCSYPLPWHCHCGPHRKRRAPTSSTQAGLPTHPATPASRPREIPSLPPSRAPSYRHALTTATDTRGPDNPVPHVTHTRLAFLAPSRGGEWRLTAPRPAWVFLSFVCLFNGLFDLCHYNFREKYYYYSSILKYVIIILRFL